MMLYSFFLNFPFVVRQQRVRHSLKLLCLLVSLCFIQTPTFAKSYTKAEIEGQLPCDGRLYTKSDPNAQGGYLVEQCANIKDPEKLEICRKEQLHCAFRDGAGVEPALLSESIAMIVLTFVFLWAAWVIFSQYQSFVGGEISFYDLAWRIIRTIIILLIFTIFIRP